MTSEGYHIVKEGYLLKESYYFKQLRKRWIVLNPQYIDCYKDNLSDHTTEAFDLNHFSDVRASIDAKPFQFELIPNEANSDRPHRVFLASSTKEMNQWIHEIKHCLVRNTDACTYKVEDEYIYKVTDVNVTDTVTPYDESCDDDDSSQSLYTQSDIQQLSIWYSKELQRLEQQHVKEKDALMGRIDHLMNELNGIKRNNNKRIKKRLKQLTVERDRKYQSYITELEHKCDILQNEANQRHQTNTEIGRQSETDSNALDHTHHTIPTEIQRGSLIFQQQNVSDMQLSDMISYYKVHGMSKAPKIIFGDNDILEEYDNQICYKIKTSFRGYKPTLYDFRMLMNKQFGVLQEHLTQGHDVIIPLPTSQDVELNGKERFYKFGKQIIYHRIGIDKGLKLPMSFVEYIQNKIDQLTKYCSSTHVVQSCVYNKTNYKQFANPIPMQKEKEVTHKPVVLWQWKNGDNEWISYDHNIGQKIERLPTYEVYEHTATSFITKLSKKTAIYVDIQTEERRDVKRIKITEGGLKVERKTAKRMKHKEKVHYMVNWQWKDDAHRWIAFKREISRDVEALKIRESYEYSVGLKRYKITKQTRNFALQIDLETFEKCLVRQTRKEISTKLW